MNSKAVYRKKFEEMLEVEKKARDLYKYYVDRITDEYLLDKFKEIYKDEEKHVAIVSKFISEFYPPQSKGAV